jgi:hypothetical protein
MLFCRVFWSKLTLLLLVCEIKLTNFKTKHHCELAYVQILIGLCDPHG